MTLTKENLKRSVTSKKDVGKWLIIEVAVLNVSIQNLSGTRK